MDGVAARIGNPATDAIIANDALHRDRMALASSQLLNAIEVARGGVPKGALPGSHLVWEVLSDCGGEKPLSTSAARQRKAALAQRAEQERVRTLTVKRDPCPLCGVRMDIGCKHRRAA